MTNKDLPSKNSSNTIINIHKKTIYPSHHIKYTKTKSKWEIVPINNSESNIKKWKKEGRPIESRNKVNELDFTYKDYKSIENKNWTQYETNLLLILCKKFNLDFIAICSYYNKLKEKNYKQKSVEELKDRFYNIYFIISGKRIKYDLNYEKKRKFELTKFHNRTYSNEIKLTELLLKEKKIKNAINKKKKTKNKMINKIVINKSTDVESMLPKAMIENIHIKKINSTVMLRSSYMYLEFENISDTEKEKLNEYMEETLKYKLMKKIRIPSKPCVELWNELRYKVIMLNKLQENCQKMEESIRIIKGKFD